ncbi:MAG: diguanylate cyclase/phosphodiesterase with sensor [Bryobacterales bacterium]|jgi:hypothetical protein|nr:diguanylate cyclase/phosphodiesterase with sensor [Bryobacterales bacterium]
MRRRFEASWFLNNLAEETRFQGGGSLNGRGFSSVIATCIEARQSPVAIIEIYKKETNAFQVVHEEFCQSAANIISAVIARDRAEENLRSIQSHLSHLITSGPAVIYALRLQANTLSPITVGENIRRVTGCCVEDVLRPDWWQEHAQCDRIVQVAGAGHVNGDHFVREYQLRCADNRRSGCGMNAGSCSAHRKLR